MVQLGGGPDRQSARLAQRGLQVHLRRVPGLYSGVHAVQRHWQPHRGSPLELDGDQRLAGREAAGGRQGLPLLGPAAGHAFEALRALMHDTRGDAGGLCQHRPDPGVRVLRGLPGSGLERLRDQVRHRVPRRRAQHRAAGPGRGRQLGHACGRGRQPLLSDHHAARRPLVPERGTGPPPAHFGVHAQPAAHAVRAHGPDRRLRLRAGSVGLCELWRLRGAAGRGRAGTPLRSIPVSPS